MVFGIFEKSICELHGKPLQDGEAVMRYGLIRFSPEYHEARKTLFPNSNSFKLGGCYVDKNNKKTTNTKFCMLCRQAEVEWQSKNQTHRT